MKYDVPLAKIPYLSSFVSFQSKADPQGTEFTHGPIPHFNVVLKGMKSGFRHCFRPLPADLSKFHVLCETYEFLCVDVLRKKGIDIIYSDLLALTDECDTQYMDRPWVFHDKPKARDAAFRLLYLIRLGEFENEEEDSWKVYKAVFFVVSHPGTFTKTTRTVIRAAYEERFVLEVDQLWRLNEWENSDDEAESSDSEDDRATDEEGCVDDSRLNEWDNSDDEAKISDSEDDRTTDKEDYVEEDGY